MLRFLAGLALVALLLGAPDARAEDRVEAPERAAAQPGDHCLPGGGCRPSSPSPWNGAAFGLAAAWIAWQARRRARNQG